MSQLATRDAMAQATKRLTAIEYFRDQRPWTAHQVGSPAWADVEAAVRRMDNFCCPIVQLHCTEFDDDEDMFNIAGGGWRYAMFHMMGEWRHVDESLGDGAVHLWESDQGDDCTERNVAADVEKVLRIAKRFYETGSDAQLAPSNDRDGYALAQFGQEPSYADDRFEAARATFQFPWRSNSPPHSPSAIPVRCHTSLLWSPGVRTSHCYLASAST